MCRSKIGVNRLRYFPSFQPEEPPERAALARRRRQVLLSGMRLGIEEDGHALASLRLHAGQMSLELRTQSRIQPS